MSIRPKAIYIGPAPLGKVLLKQYEDDYDFVTQVPDIATLWNGLDNNTISNDAQIILTIDAFYDPSHDNDAFEQLVAMMSPYCFFGILAYKPELEGRIRESISQAAAMLTIEDSQQYAFIDKNNYKQSMKQAIARYIKNTDNQYVADILAGRDPERNIEESETVTENPQTEVEPASQYDFEDDEYSNSDYLGRVLAVTSSKGGSGKSTVAMTLATYLAHASENSYREKLEKRPLKIIVLDLDVRDGQIGFLTGNFKPTVLEIRLKGISHQSLDSTIIHSPRLKIDMLLAPKRPRAAEETPAEFYLDLIRLLKTRYDYVILDTSVNYLDPLLEKVAYPIADQIVFVTDIVVNSVFSMTRWVQEVTRPKEQQGMGIPKNKIGVVVNKSMTNVAMDANKIKQGAVGLRILSIIPNNAKLMAHSANMQSMELVLRHNDIREAFKRLAKTVIGKSYKLSENLEP